MVVFCRENKLVKLRKLDHDKTIKYDFLTLLFKNDTLGHKICTISKVVQKVLYTVCETEFVGLSVFSEKLHISQIILQLKSSNFYTCFMRL